jgi:excisionase family DNA binding protein
VTSEIPSLIRSTFLTVFQTATILRVSKQTVYSLVHHGDLEAVRVGGSFRIPAHIVNPHASADRYQKGEQDRARHLDLSTCPRLGRRKKPMNTTTRPGRRPWCP